MRWLVDRGHITKGRKRALDYGCGQGFDAAWLSMEAYDPHYRPRDPGHGYAVITCHYVLNVIPCAKERERVLADIIDRLAPGGVAFVTVRRDLDASGWRKNGTWQGIVDVPGWHEACSYPGKFAIYTHTKKEKDTCTK
jgi:hypothetical protein